ncbi:MAG: permease [Candidatus Eisenbacteria bacterium]|uniref:Permease n=1 Tax=Eiseniibacteriota bacterium TaxID=2212470 RepID=A0A937X9V4_UNCEI|nr:permease [Candidatus Eisenbacteria bacterium]
MEWRRERKAAFWLAAGFLACYFLPVGGGRFDRALLEAFHLVKWYAREHVLLCLIPAFFIAGAIAVFVSQASVMRYLGAGAKKVLAYGVASVSGSVLAVCSCTVLPLFAGIYRMGAGLGPATAFLYSGPAINVLAIILTARILGVELGIARAVGAIAFSVLIGLAMHGLFRGEERAKAAAAAVLPETAAGRPLGRTALYFASLVAVLVFANWGEPAQAIGFWHAVHSVKWVLTGLGALGLGAMLVAWFGMRFWAAVAIAVPPALLAFLLPRQPLAAFGAGIVGLSIVTSRAKGELGAWFDSSWSFAKQILPLLLLGVLVAGVLLGRPGEEGLIPSHWVSRAVGGNSLAANLFAAVAGAFMYFATLTEVPILQGLIGSGMGKGPALALLLAGPALSLPNMLVIRSVMGTKKTLAYVLLVVVAATGSGLIYGALF